MRILTMIDCNGGIQNEAPKMARDGKADFIIEITYNIHSDYFKIHSS